MQLNVTKGERELGEEGKETARYQLVNRHANIKFRKSKNLYQQTKMARQLTITTPIQDPQTKKHKKLKKNKQNALIFLSFFAFLFADMMVMKASSESLPLLYPPSIFVKNFHKKFQILKRPPILNIDLEPV